MSVSNDETMVMINNTHRGFDLYSVSQQSILYSFTENGLPPSAASVFVDSDRAVAYAGSDGTLRLWDVHSKSIVFSFPGAGEFLYSDPSVLWANATVVHPRTIYDAPN